MNALMMTWFGVIANTPTSAEDEASAEHQAKRAAACDKLLETLAPIEAALSSSSEKGVIDTEPPLFLSQNWLLDSTNDYILPPAIDVGGAARSRPQPVRGGGLRGRLPFVRVLRRQLVEAVGGV